MISFSKHFANVGIVSPGDTIYKDECVCSFDTPESENGLYICMKNFEGVSHEFLDYHFKRHGYTVYLHHKRLKFKLNKPESTDTKPKRLAIGLEGGFDPDIASKDFRYEDIYSLFIMPERLSISLPNPDLPELILQSINSIKSSESTDSKQSDTNVWDGEQRKISKFAKDLKQLPNPPKIPPSGWKCEQCDLRENLWLNLTDGSILCGRKFYDGSGGNNHAVEHYEKHKYPLSVKLGTITPDTADVYSYGEEDMVLDPLLGVHLSHFGIDVQEMTKTEKSMVELEIDMNQKIGEWSVIQEDGKNLELICGPGFTGLKNLGNSCYMNSVLQVIFSISEFQMRYQPPQDIYSACDSISHFNHQMAKLAYGLLSGRYGVISDSEQAGIPPKSFKHFVCGNDRNFSTKRQQDAHEFFLFLMELMERNSGNIIQSDECLADPSKCFKVVIEDRIECSASRKVRYTSRAENCLSLHIDLDLATNKEEIEAHKKAADPNALPEDKAPRPNVQLTSLIDLFAKQETLTDFYSAAISAKTTALKSSKILRFPRVLVLQIKKFQVGSDWVPKKLDVSIDVPDIINLEHIAGQGIQPGEEELEEAADNTSPLDSVKPDPKLVELFEGMGFKTTNAINALKLCDNDFDRALDCICDIDTLIREAAKNPARGGEKLPHLDLDNGSKLYQLKAFISHMGTSTSCGHYVCHIRKDDRWCIYNDEKVAISRDPPRQFGYLYFYERIQM